MDEHQSSAPCIPVWKTGVYLSTLMLGEMARRAKARRAKAGIPCWNRTSLCGFANRRLNCSANGIEIESAGGSFRSRLRCFDDAVHGAHAIRLDATNEGVVILLHEIAFGDVIRAAFGTEDQE